MKHRHRWVTLIWPTEIVYTCSCGQVEIETLTEDAPIPAVFLGARPQCAEPHVQRHTWEISKGVSGDSTVLTLMAPGRSLPTAKGDA